MLSLWRRGHIILFFVVILLDSLLLLLLLWLSGLLGLLLLLRWGVGNSLLNVLCLAGYIAVDWLISDRLVPSRNARVVGTPFLIEEELEAAGDDRGCEEIGEGEAVANQVGIDKEVVFHDLEAVLRCLHAIFDVLLVVRVAADEWAEPACEFREEFLVGEREPAKDRGIVLLRLAEEGGLFVLGGDYEATVLAVGRKSYPCQSNKRKQVRV